VECGFVLNLISRFPSSVEAARQPFSRGALTLHTEGSGRPASERPRYIALCCEHAGGDERGRTLAVRMRDVAAALAPDDLELLSQTRYRRHTPGEAIAAHRPQGWTFCFRDFEGEPLEWTHDGGCASPERINAALEALLIALYRAPVSAVRWRRGCLAILDNQLVFHGREAMEPDASPRHLRRVRLLAGLAA
jgi:hypothetical protein